MPRLTAHRRLSIMTRALAYAEANTAKGRGPVPLTEVADVVGETVDDVRESLDALTWVELEIPGGIVSLLDAISLENDMLEVKEAWWRRLAVLTPPEAARLYTKAAVAAGFDSADSVHLRTAMRKLRRTVSSMTVVEGKPPPAVSILRSAGERRHQVLLGLEGLYLTVTRERVAASVVSVFRTGAEWMVTLRAESDEPVFRLVTGDVATVPVARLFDIRPIDAPSSTDADASPSVIDPDPLVKVGVEYPRDRDWVLDALAPTSSQNVGVSRRRATVMVWGPTELKTLMLRLGPEAELISPESMSELQSHVATEILSLYLDT